MGSTAGRRTRLRPRSGRSPLKRTENPGKAVLPGKLSNLRIFSNPTTSKQKEAIRASLVTYYSQIADQDSQRIAAIAVFIYGPSERGARDLRLLMIARVLLDWLMDRTIRGLDPPLLPYHLLAERHFLSRELRDFSRRRREASEGSGPCDTRRGGIHNRELRAQAAHMSKALMNPKISCLRRFLQRPGVPGRRPGPTRSSPVALSVVEAHLKPIWGAFPIRIRVMAPSRLRAAIHADSLFRTIQEQDLPSLDSLSSKHLYCKRLARILQPRIPADRKP